MSLSPLALALPGADARWDVFETDGPRVECTHDAGEPWCRSTTLVQAPLNDVAAALQDMASHPTDRTPTVRR